MEEFKGKIVKSRFIAFYLVPKVRFAMHLGSQALFMVFHTYMVLSFDDASLYWAEVIYWLWASMRAVGEVHEMYPFTRSSLRAYWNSAWNKIDILTLLLTLFAAALRIGGVAAEHSEDGSDVNNSIRLARVVYALLSIPVFLRLAQYLRYFKSVGTLTIILSEMANDVQLWSVILILSSSAFAVAFGSLLNEYNATPIWYKEPLGLAPVWHPFWAVFGGPHKDRIDAYAKGEDDVYRRVAPFVLWGFLFVVLILIRLLVAMLASTYNRISKESADFWLFERAQLIAEFKDSKPPLPPPLNLVWYALQIPAALRRRRDNSADALPPTRGFKNIPNMKQLTSYMKREQQALKRCIKMQQDRRDKTAAAQSERQALAIRKLEDQSRARFEALNGRLDKMLGTRSPR